jgi:hypothetical protein
MMDDYEPVASFGEEAAEAYDEASTRGDEEETVDFLEQLAIDGPVLELAIGTGRVALPLAERGLRVVGLSSVYLGLSSVYLTWKGSVSESWASLRPPLRTSTRTS